MSDNTIQFVSCSFCGKGRKEIEKLIVSEDAARCNECVDLCDSIIHRERMDRAMRDAGTLDPIKIKEYLDQYIIGQGQAKMTLSVAIVNHYKRIRLKPKIRIDKANVLLYGPSGSGKTILAKTVAEYIDVPFVIADATTLTEAGYVGEDVESVISRLLAAANGDAERAQQGIVFIDEIDKISRKSESNTASKDISGEGVQQALLKLVEGTKCKVSTNKNESVEVDTSNILFIAGGAFVDLERILQNKHKHSAMGFAGTVDKTAVELSQATPDDFTKFGMIPEFTGRFPIMVHTDELTEEELVRVLTDAVGSPIAQMQFYFEADGIELDFEPDALKAIAAEARKFKTGARGLRAILERVLMPYQFALVSLKQEGVKRLLVTEAVITSNAPITMIS